MVTTFGFAYLPCYYFLKYIISVLSFLTVCFSKIKCLNIWTFCNQMIKMRKMYVNEIIDILTFSGFIVET